MVALTGGARKLALTVHVTTSVGWAGAVMTTLGLAVVGFATGDALLARSMYLAMDALAWTVLVPLAAASFGSGVLQALVTPWGLVRHYWVVVKLAITVVATAVLLVYTRTLDALADSAYSSAAAGATDTVRSLSPVLHAGLALAALVWAVGLSVHKPKGLTRYGWRQQNAQRPR